jgi:hypothetical protein
METCESSGNANNGTLRKSKDTSLKGTPVSAPPATVSYAEKQYHNKFGCAVNELCGPYGDKDITMTLIAPSGTTSDIGPTRTDASGRISYTFTAPPADGNFMLLSKVTGVTPVGTGEEED